MLQTALTRAFRSQKFVVHSLLKAELDIKNAPNSLHIVRHTPSLAGCSLRDDASKKPIANRASYRGGRNRRRGNGE